ncbi:MAG TPA: zinc ribbon domain-containing protein [Bryobacteraceae bacterium]|jgi:hypothetical protein
MWYPNKPQWRVIWIAAALAALALSAKLDSATALAVCSVGFAALVVWKLQGPDPSEPLNRCDRCGKEIRPEWQYCPFCGEFIEE